MYNIAKVSIQRIFRDMIQSPSQDVVDLIVGGMKTK